MKPNTLRLGAAIFALIITTAVGVGYTLAYGGWGGSPEKRAEVKEAIENKDYNAFISAVGEGSKFIESITEENFDRFAEAKQLAMDGDKEEAKAIFEELGIIKMGMFHGMHHKGFGDPEKIEAVKSAIENNDYEAWVKAVGNDHPKAEFITEDNFSRFVEAHNLMQDGKYDEAKEIFEELGIQHHGKFKRWHK